MQDQAVDAGGVHGAPVLPTVLRRLEGSVFDARESARLEGGIEQGPLQPQLYPFPLFLSMAIAAYVQEIPGA